MSKDTIAEKNVEEVREHLLTFDNVISCDYVTTIFEKEKHWCFILRDKTNERFGCMLIVDKFKNKKKVMGMITDYFSEVINK